jgi:phospholipid/cholesterol/gamma-HCH transport system substrate-binding protein
MAGSRTFANLVAIAVASAVLLLYAGTQLVATAVLDRTYPLTVEIERADGLLAEKEVTYNGVGIGQVEAVTLSEEAALVHMQIDHEVRIPVEHDLVVLRSSAVGEQAVDFRPYAEITDATEFHEPGDTVQPREVLLPPPVQDLLELAADVFEPVDKENVGIVVSSLADAVRGRSDDIRGMLVDSARFSESVADHGEDYDRLFASSRVVNRTLADNRETLARLITEMSDATAILTDMRSDFEGLLTDAPLAMNRLTDLVHGGQANLSCGLSDLAAMNAYLAQPQNMENAAEALRVHQWFFEGFNVLTPTDPWGRGWQRVHVITELEPPPDSYLPAKRPIPDILPGGACASPHGLGAGAAVQADYRKTVPEARIVPPADARTTPVRRGVGTTPPAAPPTATAPRPGARPDGTLPATGGGAGLPFLLGAALVALSTRSVWRRWGLEDSRGGGRD